MGASSTEKRTNEELWLIGAPEWPPRSVSISLLEAQEMSVLTETDLRIGRRF